MRLLLFLVALMAATPALGAGWSTDQLTANRQFSYSFKDTDSTGLSSAVNAQQCGTIVTGWESGTTGTASLVACPKSNSILAECTSLANFTANASGSVVNPGLPFLKVDRTALPGASGASLYVYCGQQASSGTGGGGVTTGLPGIVGDTGDQSTLGGLYTMLTVPMYPSSAPHYVSCDLGGDITAPCSSTGRGTIDEPLCNVADVKTIIEQGDEWIRFDSQDDCFVYDTDDNFDVVSNRLPDDRSVLLRIDATSLGKCASLRENTPPTTSLMHLVGVSGGWPASTNGGLVVVQDICVTDASTGVWIVDDGVGFVGNRLRCETLGGDCHRAAGTSFMTLLNSTALLGNVGNPSYAKVIEISELTMIGLGAIDTEASTLAPTTIQMQSDSNANNITENKPNRLNIVGMSFHMDEGSTVNQGRAIDLEMSSSTANEGWFDFNSARFLMYGYNGASGGTWAGFQTRSKGDTKITYTMYQTSIVQTRHGIADFGFFDTPELLPDSYGHFQYGLFQQAEATNSAYWQANGNASEVGTWTFKDSFIHLDTGFPDFFRLEDISGTQIKSADTAALATNMLAQSPAMRAAYADFFVDNIIESTGELPIDDQFNGTGTTCVDVLGTGGTPCILNFDCRGPGNPEACCTGIGTGLCGNTNCTDPGVPAACCTGDNEGTCGDAVGGTLDGECDNARRDQCARIVETAVCDKGSIGIHCNDQGLGEMYKTRVFLPRELVGSEEDVIWLELENDHWGAH